MKGQKNKRETQLGEEVIFFTYGHGTWQYNFEKDSYVLSR